MKKPNSYLCKMKHFTIPVFVPMLACPNQCIFCNQYSISGCVKQPEPDEVKSTILAHLDTFPSDDVHIEVGFFGGTFTGITKTLQVKYLKIADDFLKEGRIHGIRLSTRPDYIDADILELLKTYHVSTIELGAQSLDEEVLVLAGRGHTVADIEKACSLIHDWGFDLGLQMMTGLPGDTPEKSLMTARRIIELGASNTRIYPTLVIRGTELEQLWRKGLYKPQSLNEAIKLAARLLEVFHDGGVEVIRVGLHPSDDLVSGKDLLDGPFHVSFRQLAETELWKEKLKRFIENHPKDSEIRIPVSAGDLNNAIGYNSSNRNMLLQHFRKVEFIAVTDNDTVKPFIITDRRLPLPAKNALKRIGNMVFLSTDSKVYRSISGHPDIFICRAPEGIITAPCIFNMIRDEVKVSGLNVVQGKEDPGLKYPASARYNAVITDEFIIHNSKITDPAILETFTGRKCLHVNQGYTRCNLLALSNDKFITSDKGIEKTLLAEGKEVLFVDPEPVTLKGQKHGFFPGCCGIFANKVFIAGSLKYHHQGQLISNYIVDNNLQIVELFNGRLTDVGGILFI